MNLYKIFSPIVASPPRFIVAQDSKKDEKKYYELYPETKIEGSKLNVIYMCERDEIVPTMEPQKEFKSSPEFKKLKQNWYEANFKQA